MFAIAAATVLESTHTYIAPILLRLFMIWSAFYSMFVVVWFWCASRFSVSVLRSPFSFIERFRCLPDRTWDFRSDLPECRAMSVISFYFTYFNIYHLMQFWKREKQSNQHWLQRRVCDDPWFKYVHVRWASIVVRNYRRLFLAYPTYLFHKHLVILSWWSILCRPFSSTSIHALSLIVHELWLLELAGANSRALGTI